MNPNLMTSTERDRAQSSGLFSHAMAWLAAALKYFKARAALAGLEAKEAALLFGIAAGMAIAALLLILLGYVFLIVTIVFAVAAAFHSRNAWIAVMGVAALLHFGGAVAFLFLALRRVKAGAFSATLDELKKDQQWLTNLANNR